MANPKHVRIAKKGRVAIEGWRQKHPEQALNLFEADLNETDLSNANLSKANLGGASLLRANLQGANLSKANALWTNFSGADLTGANLTDADLRFADFASANLTGANLAGAKAYFARLLRTNISQADFYGADLFGAYFLHPVCLETSLRNTVLTVAQLVGLENLNLTGASMERTIIANCNLAHCVGLETVEHRGPSHVDFHSLELSFVEGGNCFASGLETFLLNAGIPKVLVEILPSVLSKVEYCSTFICYGQPDLILAQKLVKDLKSRGVSCWLYPMDATPGEKVWGEIIEKRREAQKMIVLCSAKALVRDAVLKEIEEQKDEDANKIIPISLDNLWKENGFPVKRGQQDLKLFLLERNYADFSRRSAYESSLDKLLKGLKKKK